MNRVIIGLLVIWCVTAGIGYLSHIVSDRNSADQQDVSINAIEMRTTQENWRVTFERVEAYYVRPQGSLDIDSKPKEKQVELTDGKLVGIVSGANPQIYLLKPKQTEPQTLMVGDEWLSPWILQQINSDNVVWKNSQTNNLYTQKLFQ